MTCSHALSGSKTVALGLTCVAPTDVMKGHVDGKEGLKIFPLVVCEPSGLRQAAPLPVATH
jgi:hypothetical protein